MIKRAIILAIVLGLTGGICVAQTPRPVGLEWDANTEADLAGYHLYMARTSNGQVMGAFSYPPVLAPAHSYTFATPITEDGDYYWKITAYDTSGNESEFSEEVHARVDTTAPEPPKGCQAVY